jgi:hypothetical protein
MKPPLREVATVVRGGIQTSGLSFYGLMSDVEHAAVPVAAWPEDTTFTTSWLHGQGWHVLIWDVALDRWPEAASFKSALAATFSSLVAAGSIVAWVGREGYFCDPPQLFDPLCMSGGVLAAVLRDSQRQWVNLDPDSPMSPVSDEILLELRRASAGVADIAPM